MNTSNGATNNFEKREENFTTLNITSQFDAYMRRYTNTEKISA